MVQPHHRVISHIALVQSKHEFIDVAAHMLLAPVMIDAVVAPLQHRPDALNAVRVRHVVHKLFCLVLDRLMLVEFLQTDICAPCSSV